jgi:hypothetical protein
MAHPWDYIELMGYISAALGAFRVLSQFAIKMIAIFAREEFSKRAFQVLKISSMERAARVLHGHSDNDRLTQNTGSGEVSGARRRSKRT